MKERVVNRINKTSHLLYHVFDHEFRCIDQKIVSVLLSVYNICWLFICWYIYMLYNDISWELPGIIENILPNFLVDIFYASCSKVCVFIWFIRDNKSHDLLWSRKCIPLMYFWLPEDHVILFQLSNNTLEEISNYQFSLFEVWSVR